MKEKVSLLHCTTAYPAPYDEINLRCMDTLHDLKKLFERKFAVDTQLFPFESYDIMFCKKCGMIYAGNIDSNRGWNEYYSDTSKYENVNMSVPLSTISKYKIEMDIFQKYLSINTRVIDIGCGNGKMLSLMREGGFKHLTGVEISKKNIEFINTCYGIPAYVGDLEHLDALGDNKFQLVILNGVLEHAQRTLPATLPSQQCRDCTGQKSNTGSRMFLSPVR